MATKAHDDRSTEAAGPPEPGYEEWKRAKIDAALAQSRDRSRMIPIEQVWRDLGLDR